MLLSRIKVVGRSMEPTLRHNQEILASSIPFIFKKPKVGDIVILKRKNCIIKRIAKIKNNKFFISGDNKNESIDSRHFGWVGKREIVGKVIWFSGSLTLPYY